jgi:uncharacterized membrane protein YbaN (DUF454 family)
LKKIIFIIAGTLCVGLGVVGIFLPLLPTTPFLLLAAALYGKSSEKFYTWLVNHKILGKYIHNYRVEKALPLKSKVLTLIILWIGISISSYFVRSNWIALGLLLVIALGVTIHIISFPTLKEAKVKAKEQEE